MVLAALVDSLQPGCVLDKDKVVTAAQVDRRRAGMLAPARLRSVPPLQPRTPEAGRNIAAALDAAQRALGVAPLFDADDVVGKSVAVA